MDRTLERTTMRKVYLRQRRYREYYPPRSTPFRTNGPAEEAQYR